MSVLNISANNASAIINTGTYVDLRIWLLFVFGGIGFLIVSRLFQKESVVGLLFAILSGLSSFASVYTSLSVADIQSNVSNVIVDNISTTYITPVIQPLNSFPLTVMCVLLLIFSALNALDLMILLIQEPPKEAGRGGGGGMYVDGKTIRVKKNEDEFNIRGRDY